MMFCFQFFQLVCLWLEEVVIKMLKFLNESSAKVANMI